MLWSGVSNKHCLLIFLVKIATVSTHKVKCRNSKISGPSCSKLMMTLTIVKTLIIKYGIYVNIFAEKM